MYKRMYLDLLDGLEKGLTSLDKARTELISAKLKAEDVYLEAPTGREIHLANTEQDDEAGSADEAEQAGELDDPGEPTAPRE